LVSIEGVKLLSIIGFGQYDLAVISTTGDNDIIVTPDYMVDSTALIVTVNFTHRIYLKLLIVLGRI